jgi:hypothetical protein
LAELEWRVYQTSGWDRRIWKRLEKIFARATVYCWVFQNMTEKTADLLHSALKSDRSYLGAMAVDFSNPLHLVFVRNTLIELCRLEAHKCSIFYSMGENEDPDIALREVFEKNGYTVAYEDWAETIEQLAQAALSGRRFLEYFADSICPPSEQQFVGRSRQRAVGKPKYKNRLWAFIETTMDSVGQFDEQRFLKLGQETDRLCELFNSGLHRSPTKEKVAKGLLDLIAWASDLIEIDPASVRKPYGAYQEEMRQFFLDAVAKHR